MMCICSASLKAFQSRGGQAKARSLQTKLLPLPVLTNAVCFIYFDHSIGSLV